jgi:hypothetical protein
VGGERGRLNRLHPIVRVVELIYVRLMLRQESLDSLCH